jgi:3-hydroxybutyryl-CoA dehydratase
VLLNPFRACHWIERKHDAECFNSQVIVISFMPAGPGFLGLQRIEQLGEETMKFEDIYVGQSASISKTVTNADILILADVTLDRNPVHLDDAFASHTRFGGRIAHGILAIGLISAVLGTQLPGPGTIYLSQQVKFLAPVRPGDTIKAVVEVVALRPEKRIVTLKTNCYNQDNQAILTGEAVVLVEQISEKEI